MGQEPEKALPFQKKKKRRTSIIPGFQKKGLQIKKYGAESKRMLKRHINKGKIPVQSWATWSLIQIVTKILKEGKEDIDHDEEKANSLNEYKMDT